MLRYKPASNSPSTCQTAARRRLAAAGRGLALAMLLGMPNLLLAASGPLLSTLTLEQTPIIQSDPSLLPASPSPAPSSALDYAHSLALEASLHDAGRWFVEDGRATWRLRLHSQEARNLSVTLHAIQLPASAELRLYDDQGLLWHGPYRAAELQRAESFWTPIVPGDTLLLELSLDPQERGQAELSIQRLNHGYRDLDNRAKSGSCNIDVACSQADPWTDASRATARITIGGRRLCSAVLLNNTRQDGDPLLLTARHCGIEESEDFPASSVVVYWNYETSQCGGSPDGSLRQNQSGSQLLAEGASADFSLVRLNQQPPSQYQVHYAGWDASGLTPTSGASTHHPSGDEKRISLFSQPPSARRASVDGEPVESWAVNWEQGITEAGSSGGGLWNQDHQVIGQLSGGNSSCERPDATDVFGRLAVAWEEGSTPARQLRPWLDPAATGQLRLDGRDSGTSAARASNDVFAPLPADRQILQLDVLANDGGTWPLRLVEARSEQGQVHIADNQLIYQFAPGSQQDVVHYQFVDRWGQLSQAQVELTRKQNPVTERGGAASGWLLLLAFASLGARRWTRI